MSSSVLLTNEEAHPLLMSSNIQMDNNKVTANFDQSLALTLTPSSSTSNFRKEAFVTDHTKELTLELTPESLPLSLLQLN